MKKCLCNFLSNLTLCNPELDKCLIRLNKSLKEVNKLLSCKKKCNDKHK